MMITNKGRELALMLSASIGTTHQIQETCSLIARHAVTHGNIQEGHCNGSGVWDNPRIDAKTAGKIQDRFEKRLEKREEQIEKRLTVLVAELPHVDGEPIVVRFEGDPRGCTVKLLLPSHDRSDFSSDGIAVPQ